MLYDQHCSILLAEFNMFTKNAYVRGYETNGEEKKIKLYFCLLPSSRDSRKCRVRVAWLIKRLLCRLDTDCLT